MSTIHIVETRRDSEIRWLVAYDRRAVGMSVPVADCSEKRYAVVIADALRALPAEKLAGLDRPSAVVA